MGTPGVRFATLVVLLTLAACASPPAPMSAPTAPPIDDLTPPPNAAAPKPANDQCGAADLQYLIGRPETDIPVAVDPAHRRVVCTTCPMTRDYRVDRQTILFDEKTHLVTSVACN